MNGRDDEAGLRMRATSSRRGLFRSIAATGVLAAVAFARPLPARASCQVETLEMPVTMVGSRATATVVINGKSVPLTVDSGAFFSMLSDAVATQLNLPVRRTPGARIGGVTGTAQVGTTVVDKLQLFKGELNRVTFIVGGNMPGAGTEGLMGRNILSIADTEYDLAHGVIRFVFPNDDCSKTSMAYWAGSSPVTTVDLLAEGSAKTPAIRATVELNGTELVALFDTGATTVVSSQGARRAGVADRDWKPAGEIYGVGLARSRAWTAAFEKFSLGGEAILHNRLRVADFDIGEADMLLGIDFFLAHRIYVSKRQSKMFLTYNGGPVFAADRHETARSEAVDADPAAADGQPRTADEFARRGAASASRRDYESALTDLNRACELEPTSAAFFAQRGAIQEALKHPAKALEDFDRSLELDPGQADARFRRARLHFDAKDADGAKADLDALGRTLAPQAGMRLAMSQLYLALDRPTQAIAELDQWLPAHPNDIARGNALERRCRARLSLGAELDRALDDCNDAVSSDEKNAAYLHSRGWVRVRMGKYKDALSDFDRGLEKNPRNASLLYGRGYAETRLGDAVQGDADLAAARKIQPDIDLKLAHAGLTASSSPQP